VDDFYGAVRDGSGVDGLPTFADGLRAALITDAVLTSARDERWVEVAANRESVVDSRAVAG